MNTTKNYKLSLVLIAASVVGLFGCNASETRYPVDYPKDYCSEGFDMEVNDWDNDVRVQTFARDGKDTDDIHELEDECRTFIRKRARKIADQNYSQREERDDGLLRMIMAPYHCSEVFHGTDDDGDAQSYIHVLRGRPLFGGSPEETRDLACERARHCFDAVETDRARARMAKRMQLACGYYDLQFLDADWGVYHPYDPMDPFGDYVPLYPGRFRRPHFHHPHY